MIESRLFASCETLLHFRHDQSLTERLSDCVNLCCFSAIRTLSVPYRTENYAPLETPGEGVLSRTKAERYVEVIFQGQSLT